MKRESMHGPLGSSVDDGRSGSINACRCDEYCSDYQSSIVVPEIFKIPSDGLSVHSCFIDLKTLFPGEYSAGDQWHCLPHEFLEQTFRVVIKPAGCSPASTEMPLLNSQN